MQSFNEQTPHVERVAVVAEDKATIRRHQVAFLVRLTLLVVAVVLGYKLVRAGLYSLSAYNSTYAILKLREDGDLSAEDLVHAQPEATEIARSTAALEREMRLFAPVLNVADVIPGIGPTIGALPELLAAGKELAIIGSEGLGLLASVAEGRPEAPLTEVLLQSMAENGDLYALLGERAQKAHAALAAIPADQLVTRLAGPVAELQSATALMAASLQMGPELPALLGYDRPRTYLVLVQNNQEMRGTGGFISAVGKVSIDKGDIGDIEVTDSYNIRRDDVDHPWAPEPMQEHMDIELMFLRDANWSPDFPTTAQLVRALYQQDAGGAVDGIIAVDLVAVEHLVRALGSLDVAGSDAAVTGDNLVEQLQQFWDKPLALGDDADTAEFREWWTQRKDFMPAIASAALARVQSGEFDPLALAAEIEAALDERAIQVWSAEPGASADLAALGWDGSLQPQAGADFVALVDNNMGYNKVDAVLERSLAHSVTWPDGPGTSGLATTTITYTHPLTVPGYVCDDSSHYGENYDDMTRRCYFDYVRLYVPAGSLLVGSEGVEPDSVDSNPGEKDTQVLTGYFVLRPGNTHTVRFTYRLPAQIATHAYTVVVQRQSGIGPLPVNLEAGGKRLVTVLEDSKLVWSPTD